jgi:hypothetical protein
MSNKINFVDMDYIRTRTTIEENVDFDKIVPFIQKAQDIHIRYTIGDALYEDLVNKAISGTTSSMEDTLIRDYIRPSVAEWVTYYSLPTLTAKITNKSVSNESSEFSQSSQLSDVKFLQKGIRDFAEFYISQLTKYLEDNCESFPLYVSSRSSGFFAGVYLDKR